MNEVVRFFLRKFCGCRGVFCLVPVLAVGFSSVAAESQSGALPKVIYADPRALSEAKVKFQSGDASLKPVFEQLLANAKKAQTSKPVSVMDKQQVPPNGDKHDYISQAPYFWKDASGHYVRRDGERNPESGKDSDAGRVGRMCSNVHALAMAFYFTGDEAYAAHAAELLRVWFLNPATRMNPNLNYGQGVPGEVEGRPMGIIGTRGFVQLVDDLRLLKDSKTWTAEDQQGMISWMSEYLNWLQTSKIGIGEENATNNHGTFYDTQAAAIAAFVGKPELARKIVAEAREKRIAKQIEPDGRMPRELQRTKSFGYSAFNLRALEDLASIGQNLGIDLWHFTTSDGRSIRKALDFMAPYADPERKWPYQEIDGSSLGSLDLLLLRAASAYPDAHYEMALKNPQVGQVAASQERLLFNLGTIPRAVASRTITQTSTPRTEVE
jgi:Alginate lyase